LVELILRDQIDHILELWSRTQAQTSIYQQRARKIIIFCNPSRML